MMLMLMALTHIHIQISFKINWKDFKKVALSEWIEASKWTEANSTKRNLKTKEKIVSTKV